MTPKERAENYMRLKDGYKPRPEKEHFEVPTDMGDTLRVFDYIEELEKHIDYLEKNYVDNDRARED